MSTKFTMTGDVAGPLSLSLPLLLLLLLPLLLPLPLPLSLSLSLHPSALFLAVFSPAVFIHSSGFRLQGSGFRV